MNDLDDQELWARARPEGLPPEALRRVQARLAAALRTPTRVSRLPSWAMSALLLLVGGVAGGSVTKLVISSRAKAPAPIDSQVAASSPGKTRVRPRSQAPAPSPAAEVITPPQRDKPRRSEPTIARLSPSPPTWEPATPPGPAAPATPPEAPTVETIAAEANLLGAALRALRQNNAPARALALLDQYATQFPAGALGAEATLARVDSLRRLGRDQPLRELLEERPITKMPRARELQVLRGELRLRAGQPREAASDFEAILAGSADDELAARALYGRASCRSRLGDVDGARADLRLYLARFPRGERAPALRASGLESDR